VFAGKPKHKDFGISGAGQPTLFPRLHPVLTRGSFFPVAEPMLTHPLWSRSIPCQSPNVACAFSASESLRWAFFRFCQRTLTCRQKSFFRRLLRTFRQNDEGERAKHHKKAWNGIFQRVLSALNKKIAFKKKTELAKKFAQPIHSFWRMIRQKKVHGKR